MSVSAVGSQTSLIVQSLVNMRGQLDDLQRQLGTGLKSDDYAGIGLDRGFAVGLRSQVTMLDGFDNAIANIGVRLTLAQNSLGRLSEIGHQVKGSAFQTPTAIDSGGHTVSQNAAYSGLDELLGLLNMRAGDRYLFSGRSPDKSAVESVDHVLNGDGTRAGLLQVTSERKQADLGANGLGRLAITAPATTSVRLAEDVVSPFGFKLAGVTTSIGSATVSSSGPPQQYTVDLGATNPSDGATVKYSFTLPDGTSESITLKATSGSAGPNQFAIGADSEATAANIQTALAAALGKLADTSLMAASAMAAAKDFFDVNAAQPPQRIAGPPFNSATGFVAGTPGNTVTWYTGEMGTDPARATASARIDSSISVSYGMRANEEGIRHLVQNVAALAAMTFSASDPNAAERSAAINQRVGIALDVPSGTQKIEDIEAELAGAQVTLVAAADRHQQTKVTLSDMLQQIEGVSNEDVAAKIMMLQTRLQASLQTTSLLYQTSLVNYI